MIDINTTNIKNIIGNFKGSVAESLTIDLFAWENEPIRSKAMINV